MLDGGRDRKGHGRLDVEGDADKEEDWGSHRNNEKRKEGLGREELRCVRRWQGKKLFNLLVYRKCSAD